MFVDEYNTKYQVGDVVKVISCLNQQYKYGGVTPSSQMITKAGKKVKIKSITKTGRYKIEGSCFTWTDEMFEDQKVEPTKKREPKVGDRIRMTKDYCNAKIGMTGVIKCIDDFIFGVEFDVNFGGHSCHCNTKRGHGHWVYANQFEIIDTPKIEVGDVVRAIDNYYVITKLNDEWEGIVIATTNDEFTALTTHEKNSNHASYTRFYDLDPKHFEIIKKNT